MTSDEDQGDDAKVVSLNLGNIQTQWSIVRQAHGVSNSQGDDSAARHALVMKYAPAIRRFVQIVVRDETMADELAQDAIVRLLKGDFAGADPRRGRFRDLLKTALRNMARNYWAKENRRAGVDLDLTLVDDAKSVQLENQWAGRWRDNLLSLAWERLRSWESSRPDSCAYQVLKLRSDHPNDSSSDLAKKLSAVTGRDFSAESTRQQLRRARVRFVEFLVAEIADGLPDAGPQQLQEELISLGLFSSIKDVLPKKWQT